MIKNSQQSLPTNLANAISGYAWQQIDIGYSLAQIFRLEAENENSLYLKIDSPASKFSLLQEKLQLEWLKNRLHVSEVLLFAEVETSEFLLLSEIPGVNAGDDSLKNNILISYPVTLWGISIGSCQTSLNSFMSGTFCAFATNDKTAKMPINKIKLSFSFYFTLKIYIVCLLDKIIQGRLCRRKRTCRD